MSQDHEEGSFEIRQNEDTACLFFSRSVERLITCGNSNLVFIGNVYSLELVEITS